MMGEVKTMTSEEFQAALNAQGARGTLNLVFICPMCGVKQTGKDLMLAGVSKDDIYRYIGFSCVGRFTGAGAPRKKPDGQPCNWTLGGLFQLHKLVVITNDGERHPHFEVATPEEAQTCWDEKLQEQFESEVK